MAKPTSHRQQVICYDPDPEKPVRKRRAAFQEPEPDSIIKIPTMKRAKEVASTLPPEFPTLIRTMLPSHVAGGFWLGLPKQFCVHLPKGDTSIVLEDEKGLMHETRFLRQKTALSGGWKSFSTDHALQEGDILVFQLVEPTKFKVYIVRSRIIDEVDGALCFLKRQPLTRKALQIQMKADTTEVRSDDELEMTGNTEPYLLHNEEQDSEDTSSDELESSRSSEPLDNYYLTNGEHSEKLVDGLAIDSELPKKLRATYYELCRSHKSVLHEKLLQGLNPNLAIGMVTETASIANAIKASKITTPLEDFTKWEKTLKAFKDLGMDVGFLLTRLDQLRSLAVKYERIKDARRKRAAAEKELSKLKAKLSSIRCTINELNTEIKTLTDNENRLGSVYQKVLDASWG